MTVEELTPEVVRKFLDHLERDRRCSEVTPNQRLATIHSLARFIGTRSAAPLGLVFRDTGSAVQEDGQDRDRIPRKAEMDAVLNQPDRRTSLGARDHALLLFLYNSGARADEAAKLRSAISNWGRPRRRDFTARETRSESVHCGQRRQPR
ncbi:site-specific recombinase XerD [Bradyrhizobium sp. i1.3.1]